VARAIVAYRVCPELQIAPRHVNLAHARELLSSGGKSLVPKLGGLLVEQTASVLVVSQLGPAALAVFARPRALIRHVSGIVSRYAFVLEPTAGSFDATGDRSALRAMLVRATGIAAYIALPMTVLLALFGDHVIQIWMGPHYAVGAVLIVLVLGNFVMVSQMPVMSILVGMNAHGRAGVAHLIASAAGAGLVVASLALTELGLLGVAIGVTLPQLVVGVYVPWRACRLLALPVRDFVRHAWSGPLLSALPYGAALALARWWTPPQSVVGLAAAMVPGGAILIATYWLFVIPPHVRAAVVGTARRRLGLPPAWTPRRLGQESGGSGES
jgi:O-antigen/teichoic acid export membrane protein